MDSGLGVLVHHDHGEKHELGKGDDSELELARTGTHLTATHPFLRHKASRMLINNLRTDDVKISYKY